MHKIIIWLLGVSFVLFQFFLQLSSGVVISALMQEMAMSAFVASLLSSAFYYVYTSLQIPVGLFFDRANTRYILSGSAFLCSCGCLIFALAHQVITLFIGRLIIGAGSAFAFIGLSHLLRQHFPLRQFGFLIGLSETLGFVATMLGVLGLGLFIQHLGWRQFIIIASFFGFLISLLIWRFVPGENIQKIRGQAPFFSATLKQIVQSEIQWINGIFAGLGFAVITVFAAMWAIPFTQTKLECSLSLASALDSLIFLGAAISCPLFGYLTARLPRRKPLMTISSFLTGLLISVTLYFPGNNATLFAILLFAIGCSCGAYMLAYSITNELSPTYALSTATGFTNTLAMLTAPIMQLTIGYILDRLSHNGHYTLADFQIALTIIPIGLFIAAFLVYFLPEKN